MTPEGLLKLEFLDDDDVIVTHGPFTEYLLEEICEGLDDSDFDDNELESLLRGELASRCRGLGAYRAYSRFRAATSVSATFASFVADPRYQSRRRHSKEQGSYTELKTRDA